MAYVIAHNSTHDTRLPYYELGSGEWVKTALSVDDPARYISTSAARGEFAGIGGCRALGLAGSRSDTPNLSTK